MLTDIYIVRHGQPQMDTGLVYNEMPGPPLSDAGRREAQAAAEYLADKGIQHLFVSPFDRTTQTAEQIIERLDVPVTFAQAVAEARIGEGPQKVRVRVSEFIDALEDSAYERVAIVTHGSPIKELLMHLSREKIDLTKHVYPQGNPAPTCGIWHVRRGDNSRIFTLVFNPSLLPASV